MGDHERDNRKRKVLPDEETSEWSDDSARRTRVRTTGGPGGQNSADGNRLLPPLDQRDDPRHNLLGPQQLPPAAQGGGGVEAGREGGRENAISQADRRRRVELRVQDPDANGYLTAARNATQHRESGGVGNPGQPGTVTRGASGSRQPQPRADAGIFYQCPACHNDPRYDQCLFCGREPESVNLAIDPHQHQSPNAPQQDLPAAPTSHTTLAPLPPNNWMTGARLIATMVPQPRPQAPSSFQAQHRIQQPYIGPSFPPTRILEHKDDWCNNCSGPQQQPTAQGAGKAGGLGGLQTQDFISQIDHPHPPLNPEKEDPNILGTFLTLGCGVGTLPPPTEGPGVQSGAGDKSVCADDQNSNWLVPQQRPAVQCGCQEGDCEGMTRDFISQIDLPLAWSTPEQEDPKIMGSFLSLGTRKTGKKKRLRTQQVQGLPMPALSSGVQRGGTRKRNASGRGRQARAPMIASQPTAATGALGSGQPQALTNAGIIVPPPQQQHGLLSGAGQFQYVPVHVPVHARCPGCLIHALLIRRLPVFHFCVCTFCRGKLVVCLTCGTGYTADKE